MGKYTEVGGGDSNKLYPLGWRKIEIEKYHSKCFWCMIEVFFLNDKGEQEFFVSLSNQFIIEVQALLNN